MLICDWTHFIIIWWLVLFNLTKHTFGCFCTSCLRLFICLLIIIIVFNFVVLFIYILHHFMNRVSLCSSKLELLISIHWHFTRSLKLIWKIEWWLLFWDYWDYETTGWLLCLFVLKSITWFHIRSKGTCTFSTPSLINFENSWLLIVVNI